MHFVAILAAAALAALSATSAQAAVRITDDPGGLMTQYASRFSAVRQTGEKVVIDGPCLSACTMVLGILPREQVCVTQNAVLGFHAAWNYDDTGRRVVKALPMLHPAYLLRQPAHKRHAWRDLQALRRALDGAPEPGERPSIR